MQLVNNVIVLCSTTNMPILGAKCILDSSFAQQDQLICRKKV